MAKKDLDDAQGADYLKLCCKPLSAFNVQEVVFEYDGSGDSGDFETTYVLVGPDANAKGRCLQHGTPDERQMAAAANSKRVYWTDFVSQVDRESRQLAAENKSPVMTAAMCEKMLDEAFSLLPGGWEINDGSFGVIRINIARERVDVEHNERYTDVRHETFSY